MKTLSFFVALIISIQTSAQTTYVPDDNFEAFLESQGMGNGVPNDDYVTTANISGVGVLGIWSLNISDLTGIEDFTSLTTLYCYGNQLTSLDLSQNTNIMEVRCYNNLLTSINVTQNNMLSALFCYGNQLTSLDVTQNGNLSELRCFNNNLTALDVTQNSNLTALFCYDNPIGSLDVTQNPNLTNLRCYDNQLTTLDVSQNPGLLDLFCYDNQLTSLDVSQNTSLLNLFCYDNQLASLDVSQNSALEDLRCWNNQLTTLDVSTNYNLNLLWCQNNDLECLNANNGSDLALDCSGNQLSCVSVVDPSYAYANATYDAGITFQIVCFYILDNDVTQNGTTLTADQGNASYQWINCANTDGVIQGETNQSYTPTTTGYYAVIINYNHPCGGNQVDTSSCHYVDYTSIEELTLGKVELVKVVDLMGRETPIRPNTVLIYIYNNGTTERVFKLEE